MAKKQVLRVHPLTLPLKELHAAEEAALSKNITVSEWIRQAILGKLMR
jgi:hypothetical protein